MMNNEQTVIYVAIGTFAFLVWVAYKIYIRQLEEIRDLRDELYETRGEFNQIIKLKDEQYQALAEMRDTTKIEDVMTALERDIKAQNYRHEQEMMSTFHTTKSLLEKYVAMTAQQEQPSKGRVAK